ncbi:Catenin-beta-like protein [Kalaharituber pfeilii]|nr:Catenin-beta-like protein [Kalaharituber pfeilii]
MADIDSLFKKPNLPSKTTLSSKKRKLEPFNPLEAYKSARVETSGKGKGKAAAVEDGDSDMMGDDGAAGPELPSGQVFDDEDDEGRFFGGGVSDRQVEILDFMEEREKEDTGPERIDVGWLRKTALNFEKKISKNAEMRGKFEDEPQKFMVSEAELDEAIKLLSILSEHPELYEEFANLGCAASLVGLLTHENSDIAGEAVQVISELTDEDVEAETEQWNALVDAMVDADLLDMLVSNLSRLDESTEGDRSVVYHTLSVFENLASQQRLAEAIATKTSFFTWILNRLQVRESPVTQNKQYAGEILAILLQSSQLNRKKFTELNGVDILLQLLSPYRKRDPTKGGEEEELLENIFDAVTCVVNDVEGKEKFVEAEGVELALIMLREGKMSKNRALRLLDHACGGEKGVMVCERLVEALGLKTIFGMFMKKQDAQTNEHLLGIFAALLRTLPADSAPRIRTLAKFVEKDYEKIERLLKLRDGYAAGVKAVERSIEAQKKQLDEEEWDEYAVEWFSRRLDGGLFCLQITDLVLAWMCAEDDGARKRVEEILEKKGMSTAVVRETLQEQLDSMEEEGEVDDETRNMKEMLATLIKFV